jgi:hypothetical protein
LLQPLLFTCHQISCGQFVVHLSALTLPILYHGADQRFHEITGHSQKKLKKIQELSKRSTVTSLDENADKRLWKRQRRENRWRQTRDTSTQRLSSPISPSK